jgi:hydroxymethylpyrimidine pyrophosphatase-like HAD family hydrolase
MTTLYATDLDRTLIYSARAAGVPVEDLVVVERHEGRDISFVSAEQLTLLDLIAERALVVPVTTRTLAQYRRVTVWAERPPEWAVVANGGIVLHHGRLDDDWYAGVLATVARDSHELAAVAAWLGQTARPWIDHVRVADDLFLYTIVDRDALPAEAAAELAATLAEWGWQLSIQGRKLYAVPVSLGKGPAVLDVARRTGAERVLAAGDSLLDRDLLDIADRSLRPAHGELHDTGVAADLVTKASGLAAGEEMLRTVLTWLGGDEAPRRPGGRVPPVRHGPVART